MIGHTTTLVLGAGASEPYGLPVGLGLHQKIISGLQGDGDLWDRLIDVEGIQSGDLQDFRERLPEARAASIDAFVRRNPHFEFIAKLAIAVQIMGSESGELLENAEEERDWYRWLWEVMERADDFRENQLRIITFNYDHSFEYYFGRRLPAMYGDDRRAEKLLDRILPIHVHGKIESDYQGVVPSRDALRDAAKSLKLLPPVGQPDPVYEEASRILSDSDVICFLGFAYHKDLLERLMPSGLEENVKVFGTTFGMPGADRDDATERLRQIIGDSAPQREREKVNVHMGNASEHARLFLENNPIL